MPPPTSFAIAFALHCFAFYCFAYCFGLCLPLLFIALLIAFAFFRLCFLLRGKAKSRSNGFHCFLPLLSGFASKQRHQKQRLEAMNSFAYCLCLWLHCLCKGNKQRDPLPQAFALVYLPRSKGNEAMRTHWFTAFASGQWMQRQWEPIGLLPLPRGEDPSALLFISRMEIYRKTKDT